MLYKSGEDFLKAPNKCLTFFGMSGVGKTTLGHLLPSSEWFHYSVDYRIGTRYLDDEIGDCFKRLAMKDPVLRDLLRQDSIYIGSNISIGNLAPLSAYVGMLGAPSQGGLDLKEFKRRQKHHHEAEIKALMDMGRFIDRAKEIYGYPHFLCDAGGSMIEVINLNDPDDPVIKHLTDHSALIYLEASDDLLVTLIKRGISKPKPMYYRPHFLDNALERYLNFKGLETAEQIIPRDFVAWVLAEITTDRAPRYRHLAEKYGYIINSNNFSDTQDEQGLMQLIAQAIASR